MHIVYIRIFVVIYPHRPRPAGGRNFAWHPSANGQPPPPRGLRCGGSLPIPPGAVMPAEHPPASGVCSHFVRPPNTRPDSVAGLRFRRFHSERGRMPPSWQRFGFAKERPFSPFHLLQLHPLHSSRAGAPPRQATTFTPSPRGRVSFGNILRVPILRPPAGRVLPSEI